MAVVDVPGARAEAADGTTPVDRRRHGRRAWLLLAAAVWNAWVWGTRLVNLANGATPRSTGFVVVHTVLFVVSLGFAAALAVIGWRMRREARAPADAGS